MKLNGTSTRDITISECIVYGSKGVLPPLHLGIGITLHQDLESRKLINLLYSFGFSASYLKVVHLI